MVNSVDDVMSLRSVQGYHFPNFEMLDAMSALNEIIENAYSNKNVNLEEQKAQMQDRFLRGRQIAFMIYEYSRVTGSHDTILDYAELFSLTLRYHDVPEFDARLDEDHQQ